MSVNKKLAFLLFLFLSASHLWAQDGPYDCITGINLTNKNSITVAGSQVGPLGAFNEPGSCYSGSERAPYWFTFEICKTGTLSMFIDPEGSADYDFVLYDITNGCGAKAEVSCNYESSIGSQNITGIGCSNGSSCNTEVTVEAGRKYAMAFNRFSGNNNGFTLTIGGSCEFKDEAQANFLPSIIADTAVCGLTGALNASLSGPVSASVQWAANGPGTVSFDNENALSSNITVDLPGTYQVYITASNLVCGSSQSLSDTLNITFSLPTSLFSDSTVSFCENTNDLINLISYFAGTPPENGRWEDLSSSNRLDSKGFFNPYNGGPQDYQFRYTVSPLSTCFDSSAVLTVKVRDILSLTRDSIRCFNGGQDYRLFLRLAGGDTSTYSANGFDIVGTYYGTGFYPTGFGYNLVLSDQSGCSPVTLAGNYYCGCANISDALSPNYTLNCQNLSIELNISAAGSGSPGSIQEYIVYSDPNNPLGSIVQRSSSNTIAAQGAILPGNSYWVAGIRGKDDGQGQVNLGDTCIDVSIPIKVQFPDNSSIQISGDTSICEGSSATLFCNVNGQNPISYTLSNGSEQISAYVQPGSSSITVKPTSSGTYTITSASTFSGCPVGIQGSANVSVKKNPSLAYQLVNDSVVCLGELQGSPFAMFSLSNGDSAKVYYSINNIPQSGLNNIKNNHLYNLPKVNSGKNTIRIDSVQSLSNQCTFQGPANSINYYYLDQPTVTMSTDLVEACSFAQELNLTFNSSSNLPTRVFYNINGVRLTELVESSKTINIPVTTNLTFTLDSADYPQFESCTYNISGSKIVNLYVKPLPVITTSELSCTDSLATAVIKTFNPFSYISMQGGTFTQDTLFTFNTPGVKHFTLRLGSNCLYPDSLAIIKIDPFTLSTTAQHTSCNKANGSFIPELSGSFELPITYKFNNFNTNTGLPAGPYVISATDAKGCKVSVLDTLNTSEAFVFNAQALDTVYCALANGARVALSASGGDGSVFTYSTDGISFNSTDTIINLKPRFYWMYGKNEVGCLDSALVQIKADQPLSIDVSVLNYLKCFESQDAAFALSSPNSTETLEFSKDAYNYSSSNVITNVGPGLATFYVRELGGCDREASTSFAVTRPEQLKLILQSSGNPSCFNINNGFFVVQGQGGTTAYSYTNNMGVDFRSSGVFTGLAGGTYYTYAINNDGCSTDTLTINLISPPEIVINDIQTSINPDETGNITIIASGGFPPLTYSLTDAMYVSNNVFSNQAQGPYRAYVKDNKGCKVNQDLYLGTVSIGEHTAQNIEAYPNPCSDGFFLDLPQAEKKQVSVYNMLGSLIYEKTLSGHSYIDTQEWPSGLYTVHLSGSRSIIKLVIK